MNLTEELTQLNAEQSAAVDEKRAAYVALLRSPNATASGLLRAGQSAGLTPDAILAHTQALARRDTLLLQLSDAGTIRDSYKKVHQYTCEYFSPDAVAARNTERQKIEGNLRAELINAECRLKHVELLERELVELETQYAELFNGD